MSPFRSVGEEADDNTRPTQRRRFRPRAKRSSKVWVAVFVVGVGVIVYGSHHGPASSSQHAGGTGSTVSPAGGSSSLTALNRLTVRAQSGELMTGYSRAQFGPAWADVDHNGCDTRDDILARDLRNITRKGACEVTAGLLADPYTGHPIQFTRGVRTSGAVQIDHVVPLGWAWQAGAASWTPARREAFANDPAELLAADGPANEGKGDDGPATWLPANSAFRCSYAGKWVDVLTSYRLAVDAADKAALARILAGCVS